MIVWGGESGSDGDRLADGAAFEPVSGTWRLIAASPLTPLVVHIAVWTGEEMLVVGGRGEVDGAAYDPASDTWRVIADSPVSNHTASSDDRTVGSVWTGQELVVWDISNNKVVAYSPELNTWRDLPSIDMPGDTATLRWTGDDLYAFTGARGARLNQEGGWESLPDKDIGSADPRLTAWAGDRFLAWSDAGSEGRTLSFSPGEVNWTETEPIPIPSCEGQGEPIQTNETFVAPGWCGSNLAIFDPATSSWTTAAVVGHPNARYTVWTGTELVNWGGGCCDSLDAWRYPLAN
jgi:hypothetical protein